MSKIILGSHIEHCSNNVFFGGEISFFFQPKMNNDESHKGIFFPHFAKGPFRFFWHHDDEDNMQSCVTPYHSWEIDL
jgi:hypothetical protein